MCQWLHKFADTRHTRCNGVHDSFRSVDLHLGRSPIEFGDIHLIYQVVYAARLLFHFGNSVSAEWMYTD